MADKRWQPARGRRRCASSGRDAGRIAASDAEAIAIFQRLTAGYPELPEPYNNLAVLYARQGDFDRRRAALEKALRANPRLGHRAREPGRRPSCWPCGLAGPGSSTPRHSCRPSCALVRQLLAVRRRGADAADARSYADLKEKHA